MLRRFFISLSVILSFTAIVVMGIFLSFLSTPLVTTAGGLRYQLHAGASFKTFSEDLQQQGVLKHPLLFRLLAHFRHDKQVLKAGIYLLPQGETPNQLLDQVTSGRGLLYRAFTIIPGWNFQQLRAALHQADGLQHTIETQSDAELMKQLAGPNVPEGEFFPDTYYYVEGTTDYKLLSRAYKRMQVKAQEAWQKREAKLPYKNLNEALTAASLVEKEAHLNSERPVIAGVIVNRLQKKMLLQFDPSVIYGRSQWDLSHPALHSGFSGILRKQDLQLDTAYNTYLHKGLPPTPIAMPSMDAINAVMHPVQHQYLYFVATGSGGHQFSQTLAEHHLAVMMQRYHAQGFFNFMRIKSYLLKRLGLEENT